VDFEIFINFLRDYSKYQKLFQVSYPCHGFKKYIVLEKAFSYEHGSKNRLGEKTGKKLLCEMEEEDFYLQPIDARFILSSDDEILKQQPYVDFLKDLLSKFPKLSENKSFINDFKKFVHTVPRLPGTKKIFSSSPPHFLNISPSQTREEIIDYLSTLRHPASSIQYPASPTVDLAFYAGRFMDSCDWEPFLKAAFERNPVSVAFFKDCLLPNAYCLLNEWPNESIYDGNRLALPDEVVNYRHGDGIEKALVIINLIRSRNKGNEIHFTVHDMRVSIRSGQETFHFETKKTISFNKIIRN
jgi:hypothetical protein